MYFLESKSLIKSHAYFSVRGDQEADTTLNDYNKARQDSQTKITIV